MGLWSDIKPKGLPKSFADTVWVFAQYLEVPSDREDDRWYQALLFRDRERTAFGIMEFGAPRRFEEVERLAARIVQDKTLRQGLLSPDPKLPRFWKRYPKRRGRKRR